MHRRHKRVSEVDAIGRSAGVTYQDDEPLRAGPKELERDEHRWELDPASSEDYGDRTRKVHRSR